MFTYGTLEGNLKNQVRFLIGDTNETEPFLQDEEIQFLIALWEKQSGDSPYLIASYAAENIAAKLAREINFSSDSQSLSLDSLQSKYQALAVQLRQQHKDYFAGRGDIYIGGVSTLEWRDPFMKPLAFGRSMHDHVEAGEQDYGDTDFKGDNGQWGEFTR